MEKGEAQGGDKGLGDDRNAEGSSAGDLTLEEVETHLVTACVTLAAAGSVPAIKEALSFIETRRRAEATERHAATMEANRGKPTFQARYLATLGQSRAEIQKVIGKPLSGPVLAAMRKGHAERILEVRAIELDQLRSGGGRIRRWMKE